MPEEETATPSGPSEFGRWLYEARKQKPMSIPELADSSGVSIPQIYNIESGRSQNPQDKTRKKLTDALGNQPTAQVVADTESSATVQDVGEFVDFDPHDETDLPEVAGVYVFYDISERPIYVGQSQNIRDRIMHDHVTRFWYKAPVVQNAAYVKIDDEVLRKKIEKVMIRFMKSNAVINKQYVERDG
jgi:transcriptional regulator with XRE-family HTH domain